MRAISAATRASYGCWYLGLVAILALLTFELHGILKPA